MDRRRELRGAAALSPLGLALLLTTQTIASDGLPAGLLELAGAEHVVVVEKSSEKLFLYQQRNGGPPSLVRDFNATTGQADGAKLREGDLRTPEGVYFVTRVIEDRDLPAEYGIRAFVLDYPNAFDRADGKTGSGIWLHATDEPLKALSSRTTRGCVVLTNRDIEALTRYIRPGHTPILIEDRVEWVDPQERLRRSSQVRAAIDRWRSAWQSWDLDRYFASYSQRYSPPGGRRAWLRHKRRVAESAGETRIELGPPLILSHGDRAVATFVQHYASQLNRDIGRKLLYLEREPEQGWRILAERWEPLEQAGSANGGPPVPSAAPATGQRSAVEVEQPFVRRSGERLEVGFRLSRRQRDGRASSGRLVIVASSQDGRSWAFPGVELSDGRPARPGRGDWYSIRRFKDLRARLGPVPADARLSALEVWVYDLDDELVLRQALPLP